MSQKPAIQRPVKARVSSGVPWWLWVLLLAVGGGTGLSLFMKAIPEDPEKLYLGALAAGEAQDAKVLMENIEKLKQFPNYIRQQKLLEGITWLGKSRPLRAVPLLKEAAGEAGDPNRELRSRALRYLGSAYVFADERKTGIEVFEMMLKEDENADIARQNIASVLTENIAWEEALQHLDALAEKKFNLSKVLDMRGDIRIELNQLREAAGDFEAAIAADKTDPANATKSSKLLQCLTKVGDFEKADSITDGVDQASTRSLARAESLLAQGDLKGALDALDTIRKESPNSPESASTYGRIMLKYNTPEKAAEGLVTLRIAVTMSTRDVELYRLIVQLAGLVGDTELAGLAQQNVELLDAMTQEFDQKLAAVIKTRDGFEPRLQLADLAQKIGRLELAYKILDGLFRFYPDRESEITPVKVKMMGGFPQLVSTATGANPDAPGAPEAAPSTSETAPSEAK